MKINFEVNLNLKDHLAAVDRAIFGDGELTPAQVFVLLGMVLPFMVAAAFIIWAMETFMDLKAWVTGNWNSPEAIDSRRLRDGWFGIGKGE